MTCTSRDAAPTMRWVGQTTESGQALISLPRCPPPSPLPPKVEVGWGLPVIRRMTAKASRSLSMGTPNEDIESFLDSSETIDTRRMDVAILFAECMLRELQASVVEWEQTLVALEDLRRRDRMGISIDSHEFNMNTRASRHRRHTSG